MTKQPKSAPARIMSPDRAPIVMDVAARKLAPELTWDHWRSVWDEAARKLAPELTWSHWRWLVDVSHCETAAWDEYSADLVSRGVLDNDHLDLPLADALHRVLDALARDLTPAQRRRLRAICGEVPQRWGYYARTYTVLVNRGLAILGSHALPTCLGRAVDTKIDSAPRRKRVR